MLLLAGHCSIFKTWKEQSLKLFLECRKKESYIWATSWENQQFAYAKTKAQISFAVTAKLISAFVFATWIVHFLFFLNPKFQASSLLLRLCSLICVRTVRKPHCWFPTRRHIFYLIWHLYCPNVVLSIFLYIFYFCKVMAKVCKKPVRF